jgi:hypothetical protein
MREVSGLHEEEVSFQKNRTRKALLSENVRPEDEDELGALAIRSGVVLEVEDGVTVKGN